MKQLLLCLLVTIMFSCNNSEKQTDSATTVTPSPSTESSYDPKTGISDYTNNKKSFMLTCHIDGSQALGEEATDAEVDQFCECIWEKTKGKYNGGIVADNSKLEKDSLLKDCYENAKKK